MIMALKPTMIALAADVSSVLMQSGKLVFAVESESQNLRTYMVAGDDTALSQSMVVGHAE
jgi:hypothetical protein